MGPPKKRPPRIPYSEKLRQYDYFEHRLTEGTEDEYHFFNPSTGETIFTTDFDILNRAQSMWAPPDPVVSDNAVGVNLYPEYYASRRWGRRKFYGWKSKRAAARHIQAVARGFLARRALSHYFSQRYAKILCHFSGYYYFYDRYDTRHDADATWYKPRLAFPDDIGLYIPEDPEDYLRGDKYSYQGFEKGPYICKVSRLPHCIDDELDFICLHKIKFALFRLG